MWIIKNRKIFYGLSIVLLLLSIISVSIWGLNFGIDFKGGSLLEVSYKSGRPSIDSINQTLGPLDVQSSVREAGTDSYIIRMKSLGNDERQKVESALKKLDPKLEIKRFNSIGPVLGKESLGKSITSLILVLVFILLFIAFVFRKVSEPVSSWKYGLITLVALFHDVFIPVGVFAVLGHFAGAQIDTLFVTALLVVLGFSVHDTIVVFDRVRENLKLERENKEKKTFEHIVGESVSQTFVRSLNTSLTTIFALIVLYIVGGEVTRHFTLALLIGISAGVYSSIFIASPLLVTVQKWKEGK